MGEMPYPIVSFLDGNDFWVMRDDVFVRDGLAKIKLWLTPIEEVRKRLNFKDEELDTSEDADGQVVKVFSLSARVILSQNPERQRWLMLCDWRGNAINYDNPELYPIIKMKMEKDTNEQRLKALEASIVDLEEENIGLIRKTNEFRDRYKKILGMEAGKFEILPKELQGMEFGGGEVKKTGQQPQGGK